MREREREKTKIEKKEKTNLCKKIITNISKTEKYL